MIYNWCCSRIFITFVCGLSLGIAFPFEPKLNEQEIDTLKASGVECRVSLYSRYWGLMCAAVTGPMPEPAFQFIDLRM